MPMPAAPPINNRNDVGSGGSTRILGGPTAATSQFANSLLAGTGQANMAGTLSRALGGPQQAVNTTVFSDSTGLTNFAPRTWLGPATPSLTTGDVVAAGASDWAQTQAAQQEQRGFQQQGLAAVQQNQGVGQGLIDQANQAAAQQRDYNTQALAQAEPDLTAARAGANQIVPAAQQAQTDVLTRRAEAITQTEAQKQELLGLVGGQMAASVQLARTGLQENYRNQLAQLEATYSNNPAALEQAKTQLKFNQLVAVGNVGMQASLAERQLRIQVATAANNAINQMRLNQDQLAARAGEGAAGAAVNQAQALANVLQMNANLRQMAIAANEAVESRRQQLQVVGDQMELAGNSAVAAYYRQMDSFVNPMAPLIAAAYSLQAGEAAGLSSLATAQPLAQGSTRNATPFLASGPDRGGTAPAVDLGGQARPAEAPYQGAFV